MVSDSTLSGSAKVALFIDLLNRIGEARLRVSGSSMLPVLRAGDLLTVRQCMAADAGVGDVVLFSREGRLFAHRVVGHAGGLLVTQGDGLATADAPISDHEFLARVVSVSRRGKDVSVSLDATIADRLTAMLVRRSTFASKIIQRGHALRRRTVAA